VQHIGTTNTVVLPSSMLSSQEGNHKLPDTGVWSMSIPLKVLYRTMTYLS